MRNMNKAIRSLSKKDQSALLARERKRRRSGDWGAWEKLTFAPGSVGSGWAAFITTAHRNKVFSVLDRQAEAGVRHLASAACLASADLARDARIKDELAGPEATAIEVYPPRDELVDGADMFHIWVVPGRLPFGLQYRPT